MVTALKNGPGRGPGIRNLANCLPVNYSVKHCRCEHMVHVCLQQKQSSGAINEEGVNLKFEI